MNDTLKLQKLAAARSKLKNHQQKKIKQAEIQQGDSNVQQVVSENDHSQRESPVPQIQAYFGGPVSTSSAATFFDSPSTTSAANIENSDNLVDNSSTTTADHNPIEPDSTALEDPEINPNEIFEFANASQTNQIQNAMNSHNDISVQEQIRQLTDQLSHAVDTNGYENYSNYSDLEKRNLELASNYEREKLKSDQLTSENNEYKLRLNQLEHQMQMLRVECDTRIRNELGPLESEISTHRQTIGILVGEKTELSATLTHTELMLKQKTNECDELQTRLKSSRVRVGELEKNIAILREETNKFAQLQSGHNDEFEKVHQELRGLKVFKIEAEQDVTEMRERLKKFQEDNTNLQQTVNETEAKLNMANVKIQQLTTGVDSSSSEQFMQEKLALEKQILDLNSALKHVAAERDQASTQYQQFVQQLNNNISTLAERLQASTTQNEILVKREQELVQHIGELEKRLQTVSQESNSNLLKQENSFDQSGVQADIDDMRAQLVELQTCNADLLAKFESVRAERDEFIKDVEMKKHTVEELEGVIERLQGNTSNNAQLLAEIESEKVAASRSVEQNIKLKQQLVEMQDAFIRMTNDKADLLNQLSSEQFKFKELEDAHTHTQQQLHTLSGAIEIKDRELTNMRDRFERLENHEDDHNHHHHDDEHDTHHHHEHDETHDHHHHYNEESGHHHCNDEHENELQKLTAQVESLTTRNNQLEAMLNEVKRVYVGQTQHLTPINENEEEISDSNPSAVNDTNHVLETTVSNSEEAVDEDQLSAREVAIRQLETKFTRTMQECANLHDEKQILEHLVMQLQGETETIGEYIALYQHQRGVLKQRAMEKESQLKQLARDREHMKMQLHNLNELIRRLLSENKITDDVLLQQQAINQSTNALCQEHAELHEKIRNDQEALAKVSEAPINEKKKQETAQQIIALLSEIKTSNLVQPADISDNFHPCPLCSGQLMTV